VDNIRDKYPLRREFKAFFLQRGNATHCNFTMLQL
jgi:hypothetical protein